jgi:hypothetical protein
LIDRFIQRTWQASNASMAYVISPLVQSCTRVGGSELVSGVSSVSVSGSPANVSYYAFPVERVRYAINNNHIGILPPDSSAVLFINRSRCTVDDFQGAIIGSMCTVGGPHSLLVRPSLANRASSLYRPACCCRRVVHRRMV